MIGYLLEVYEMTKDGKNLLLTKVYLDRDRVESEKTKWSYKKSNKYGFISDYICVEIDEKDLDNYIWANVSTI